MRLIGMPRFSMDWDFFIPPHDDENFENLNAILGEQLDMPVQALGPHGENFVQTYQTQWGIVQFHLGVPGIPKFQEAEADSRIVLTETGMPVRCLSGRLLLAAKEAADRPQDQADIEFLRELQKLGKL